jgi:DNA repair exonuclease SbcCD nuclease subunit
MCKKFFLIIFNRAIFFLFLVIVFNFQCQAQTDQLSSMTSKKLNNDLAKEQFSFIVMGDNRPTGPKMPLPRTLFQIFDEIKILRPDFVLSVGDVGYGYRQTRQQFLNELDRFQSLIDNLALPFFNAPGNHEIQGKPEALTIMKQRYKEQYGSFNYANAHFIVLNTEEIGEEGTIAGKQLEWLKKDLEASKSATHIFILMHRPMYSLLNPDFDPQKRISFISRKTRDELAELFSKYPIKIVFAGHEHLFNQETLNGITYVTAGGSGAPLYAPPQRGGFSHYIIVKVNGSQISYDVVEPNHLEVTSVSGNDGLEPVSEVKVTNSTNVDIIANNIPLKLPKVSSAGEYKVSTRLIINNKIIPLVAKALSIEDNRDGSVNVCISVEMKAGTTFYLKVEAIDDSTEMTNSGS